MGNLSQWLGAVDSWMRSTGISLQALRLAALEQLLRAESQVGAFVRDGSTPAAAPPASQVPKDYRLLLPGSERPRSGMDWWDRLQTAGGFLPTLARLTAAAAIVAATVALGFHLGSSSLYVLNGLGRPVVVRVGEETINVPAFSHRTTSLGSATRVHVATRTEDGHPIEQFDADVGGPGAHDIYDVARAGTLVLWDAVYGNATAGPTRYLGAPRWSLSPTSHVFMTPPASVRTKGGGAVWEVLTGLSAQSPGAVLSALRTRPSDRDAVIAAHARWDESASRRTQLWMAYAAATLKDFPQIVRQRLNDDPADIFNLRLEQDTSSGPAHEEVCTRQRQRAAAAPDRPELQYLAARCIGNEEEQNKAFLTLAQRWPDNPWVALGAGYTLAEEARWQEALPLLDTAVAGLPAVAEELAVDVARIRRVVGAPIPPQVHSDSLEAFLAPESDARLTGMERAYSRLFRGDLEGALEAAPADDPEAARLLRLVAASDGLRPGLVKRALDLPPDEGLDEDTLLPSLAMATLFKRSPDPYKAAAAKLLGPAAPRVLKAYSLIQSGASPTQVDEAIRGLEPALRARLYVAAAILRRSACPPAWRRAAQRLLFAPERPYLR